MAASVAWPACRADASKNFENGGLKHQTPNIREAPNTNLQVAVPVLGGTRPSSVWCLRLGVYLLFGAWCLVFLTLTAWRILMRRPWASVRDRIQPGKRPKIFTRRYGLRWQAERDTALELAGVVESGVALRLPPQSKASSDSPVRLAGTVTPEFSAVQVSAALLRASLRTAPGSARV